MTNKYINSNTLWKNIRSEILCSIPLCEKHNKEVYFELNDRINNNKNSNIQMGVPYTKKNQKFVKKLTNAMLQMR